MNKQKVEQICKDFIENDELRNKYNCIFTFDEKWGCNLLWVYMFYNVIHNEFGINLDQFMMCDTAASGHVDYQSKMVSYLTEVIETGKLSWESRVL